MKYLQICNTRRTMPRNRPHSYVSVLLYNDIPDTFNLLFFFFIKKMLLFTADWP